MDCFNGKCVSHNESMKRNCRKYRPPEDCRKFEPLMGKPEPVVNFQCSDGLGVKLTAEVILTVKQIFDLAEFAGIPVDRNNYDKDSLDTPIAIMECPEGMKWEEEPYAHYEYAAYYDEYPDEGMMPLGDRTNA